MDEDGMFLMLKMCNSCSLNKGSWKKCMSRRHNPRMSTVWEGELTNGHRQCVKPDQAITIYKLRDHDTNEEYLEFDEKIIFQTPCHNCLNIRSCLSSGHKLVDWRPSFARSRVADSARPNQPPAAASPEDTPPSPPPPPTLSAPPTPAVAGSGGAKKGRGGGTPSRTKKTRGRSSAAAEAVAEEGLDEHDRGGGGRKVSSAGGKGGRGSAAAAAATEGAAERGAKQQVLKESMVTPKTCHKRKSPGSSATSPQSVSLSRDGKSRGARKEKLALVAKRGGRGSSASAGGGSGTRRRRRRSAEAGEDAPVMEIDTDSSGVVGRSLKRRGKVGSPAHPAAVTLSPEAMQQDSFDTSSVCEDEQEEASMLNGDVIVGVPAPQSPPPPVPSTVAEKLELVKRKEAELLQLFEETHKRSAQEREAKRQEMAEFQRAGEAALIAMQKETEEALRRISMERRSKAAERQKLVQQRLKEFEAEEEASRKRARERDALLEAEKARLSQDSSAADAAVAADSNGTPAGDSNGNGSPPAWASDSWILAGRTSAQNAREVSTGVTYYPAKKGVHVKDERTSARSAAVSKLLAGAAGARATAATEFVSSGGGGGGEPMDEDGSEAAGPAGAALVPANASVSERSEGAAAALGEVTEGASSAGAAAAAEVSVTEVEGEDSTAPLRQPPDVLEAAPSPTDDLAETEGPVYANGGVDVPTDMVVAVGAAAAPVAAAVGDNGDHEVWGGDRGNDGVVAPSAPTANATVGRLYNESSVAAR